MDDPQTLGIGTPESTANAKRMVGVTQGALVGGGFVGAGAVVFGSIELIKSDPDKAFHLMEAWGPWFFLALFLAWAGSKLANRLLDLGERLGDRVADALEDGSRQLKSQAEAMQGQANAMQTTASRDDRERERLATMVEYGAAQSRQALEMGQANNVLLTKVAAQLEQLEKRGS